MTIAVMAAGSGEFGWSPKISPTLPDLRCLQHSKAEEAVSLSKYTSLAKSSCQRLRLLGDPEVKFHMLDVTLAFFWCFFPQKEERGAGSREEGKWVDKET